MRLTTRSALLALVAAQAAHSLEEYAARLWQFLPPARAVAAAFAVDPARGFAISNALLVSLGVLSWWIAGRCADLGRRLAIGWAVVEIANALGHGALALAAGGYFPGLWTAPLLLVGAILVLSRVRADRIPAA